MPTSYLHQKPGQRLAFVPDAEPELIAETLVALANSEGGTLVLGANPDGRLGTIFTSDEAGDAVMAAERLCRPPVKTQWQQEQAPGGAIVMLTVERSNRLHRLADGRVLVRRGAENAPADDLEIDRLLSNRSAEEFEVQPVPGATRDDLDEDIIEKYLERRQRRSPTKSILPKDKLLQQIGALTEDGHRPSAVCCSLASEPQLFMPQCRAVFRQICRRRTARPGGQPGLWPARGICRRAAPHHRARLARRGRKWTSAPSCAACSAEELTEYPDLRCARRWSTPWRTATIGSPGAASRFACTPTGWRSPAPAGCLHTSPWTTSSRSITAATRAWSTALPVGLHRRIGAGRGPMIEDYGQEWPCSRRFRRQTPPLHRDALQQARPAAHRAKWEAA
jgi:hypothetical protein